MCSGQKDFDSTTKLSSATKIWQIQKNPLEACRLLHETLNDSGRGIPSSNFMRVKETKLHNGDEFI